MVRRTRWPETASAWRARHARWTFIVSTETSMHPFRLIGLDPLPSSTLFDLPDDALSQPRHRATHRRRAAGFSVPRQPRGRRARRGAAAAALTSISRRRRPTTRPGRSSSAAARGSARSAAGEVPELCRLRDLMSVRAYDAAHWIVDAAVCEGRSSPPRSSACSRTRWSPTCTCTTPSAAAFPARCSGVRRSGRDSRRRQVARHSHPIECPRGTTMDLELRHKRALVTGGSRGIGKAIARALALEGATSRSSPATRTRSRRPRASCQRDRRDDRRAWSPTRRRRRRSSRAVAEAVTGSAAASTSSSTPPPSRAATRRRRRSARSPASFFSARWTSR